MARPKFFFGKMAIPFLLPLAGFLASSCSYLDAEERNLPPSARLAGRVVESSASALEVRRDGADVVYTFKSIPNLMYVRVADPEAYGLVPITQTERYKSAKAESAKRAFPLSSQNTPNVPQTFLPPFEDGMFPQAYTNVASAGKQLEPVRVAIIDSGVVSATPAIQSVLKWMTNLTLESNSAAWQPHATAIASVFAGTQRNGVTENVFASNANLHSIKIAFAGDKTESLNPDLGSLQLAVALDEAIAGGAKVVNLSFTYREGLPQDILAVETLLISAARKRNVIFVTAAGNSNENIDEKKVYPAAYDIDNIVVVGSHTQEWKKASSSSYGSRVDVTAQGKDVPLSTKDGGVGYFSGTSFAAPIVASALSLYFGVLPQASYRDVLHDLYATSEKGYQSAQVTVSQYGRINTEAFLKKALQKVESKN